MSCDMYSLMRHVVGATTAVTRLRRTVTRYRHGQATTRDGKFASSDSSSHDRSPHATPDEHEPPLASSSSHHGDEVRPLATSTNIDDI